MYSYKRLPDKNEDGAALEGQEPFSSAKHPGLPSLTPHEEAVAAFWNAGYGNCGRMWGCGASSTAIALINAFNKERHRFAERIEIAEVGCGYGRDAFAFAQAGFDVVGSDIARQALILAHQDYKKMSRHAVPGSVQFLHGTIRTVAAAAVETFDGISGPFRNRALSRWPMVTHKLRTAQDSSIFTRRVGLATASVAYGTPACPAHLWW